MSLPIAALLPLAQSPHIPSDLLPPAPASVAILGHLPASAPIHLALAAIASVAQDSDGVAAVDDSIVLILAKSGSEWVSNMLSDGRGGDGDAWFASDGGKARALRKARRVVIKYLPTMMHLSLFLSLLHFDPSPPPESQAHPARLDKRPSVVILHQLSSFLVDWQVPLSVARDEEEDLLPASTWSAKPGTTTSSFSLPLSLALTSITNLNNALSSRDLPPTQLVLLDSLAGDMTLPILSPKGGKVGPSVDVRRMVEKVCDWTAVVQKPSADDNDSMTPYIYHLRLPPDQIGDGQRMLRFREEMLSEARETRRAGEDGRGLWTWLGPSR